MPALTPNEGDDFWDAGHMGCGELILKLRKHLKKMPGKVMRVVAHDAGAIHDIPAFCRMTRNELERYEPETHTFWIRSRPDW
ncbi:MULTISPECIES: sulfurtransferase TusA family protein [unclassified Achromobacter]|uniref:sulfurtransferase TusA family protein n=1 Tax=unclassified Achromobacter TaxID=2626865 RepID=UPI00069D1515|nr:MULTISPECIES: sulfurtransferase TusA family protein [unclassified Achromobacter]KOF53357.1 SirA domain-containing protein [Achromobacter sp. DMS1]KOF53889.1 SirA domain-containing protein [Achromobacter sp. DMS1]